MKNSSSTELPAINTSQVEEILLKQMQSLASPTADVAKEVVRAKALTSTAATLINIAKVKIDVVRLKMQIDKPKASNDSKQIGNKKP